MNQIGRGIKQITVAITGGSVEEMNQVERQIKKLADEITSGSVDEIQFISSLDNGLLRKHEYVELIVRSIFMEKIKKELKRKKRNKFIAVTLLTSIAIFYLFGWNKCNYYFVI